MTSNASALETRAPRVAAMKLDLTPAEFAELIERCNLNFAETGRLCGVDPSTARRWTKTTKPAHYAVAIIKLLAERKLDVLMYRALKAAYNDPSRVGQLLSLVESEEP
jgi:hypothetical protein